MTDVPVPAAALAPSPARQDRPVALEGRGLRKTYGPITAVDGVDIRIHAGEITAIVGDNGAGKSTLVKMFSGAIVPDGGQILVEGRPVSLRNPQDARREGIETVFQDLALAPNRDVVQNLFLGRELLRGGPLRHAGILDKQEMRRRAEEQVQTLGINIPHLVGWPIGRMSGGQRQSVAVARGAYWARTAMLMDEPTAALGLRESRKVLSLARQIADRGLAVVLISHILPHVMELADRVIVMRHGQKVAELTDDISSDRLIALIVGVDAHDAAADAEEAEGSEDATGAGPGR
ncbi:MAG: ATP-binding cassette domain-containing protein [Chloroflexota bacterium]